MNLEFSDITYEVNRGWSEKGDGRTILHGVSGTFRTGQLTAIMGPSGAGKSTLLNVLSGYRSQFAKGSMKVNGKPLNRRLFHKSSRYIAQEDLLPPLLTTKEAMHVAATLKLPASTTTEEREVIVEENLSILGLLEAANTPTERLSGGQKKRLSIALELVNNPYVFFLDEPTSGLDNVTTKQTLKLLSVLAKGGRTIVCTIHQPSATLFDLFDSVYVLGKGRCVYQGSVKNLLPFLSSAGFRCPTYHNPADYVIEVVDSSEINISVLSKAMENGRISHTPSKEQINQLDYEFSTSPTENEEDRRISRQSSSDGSDGVFNDLVYRRMAPSAVSQSFPISGRHQFQVLAKRMFKQIWRNKTALHMQFLHHLLCGLLVGCVFYGAARDSEQMFNHVKFCVSFVLFHTYTHIMLPALVFPAEVKLLKKEHFNRWYSINPYYSAYMLTKLPGQIIFGMLFNTIIYFMSGLPNEPFRFGLFSLIGTITVLASDALGLAIGANFNVTNGSALGPAIIAPFLGLSVYGLDFAKNLSWLTQAAMKLSFMRCGVIATIITIFGFDRESMDCHEVYCHFKEPKKVLQFVDADAISVWSEIGTMVILTLIFNTISYCALRFRVSIR